MKFTKGFNAFLRDYAADVTKYLNERGFSFAADMVEAAILANFVK